MPSAEQSTDDRLDEVETVCSRIEKLTGRTTDRNDRSAASALIRREGHQASLVAVTKAFHHYVQYDDHGNPTEVSWLHAWRMAGGVAANTNSYPDCQCLDQLIYLRGILNKKIDFAGMEECLDFLVTAISKGVPLPHLARTARLSWTYGEFRIGAYEKPEDWRPREPCLGRIGPRPSGFRSVDDLRQLDDLTRHLIQAGIDGTERMVGSILYQAYEKGLPLNLIRSVAFDATDVIRLDERLDAALYRHSRH